ncbi:response regulator [Paraburkholderia sp. RL17-347-BIC-D]|uniref:response regulator n=1 Tax=Paraburkholderia sp. RL17-347-BIC-D TaxID=3031632 RepID=UPI0038B6C01A
MNLPRSLAAIRVRGAGLPRGERRQRHDVKRATSGTDALSIVKSFAPDVALIDISMPGMDGSELAQLFRLRAQCSLTKLVALTGSVDVASKPETDERIFDAHLIEPLSLDDLEDVLRPL